MLALMARLCLRNLPAISSVPGRRVLYKRNFRSVQRLRELTAEIRREAGASADRYRPGRRHYASR